MKCIRHFRCTVSMRCWAIREARLPIAAFMFGITGTSLALFTQIWMLGYDWPMIIGGKNFASLPPFVPVIFEFTVLLAALGMVGTFLIASDLKPYKWPRQFDVTKHGRQTRYGH